MQKYKWPQALFLSFYSRELYRDVGKNWRGIGLIYLLILSALCWFFLIGKMQLIINELHNVGLPPIIKQVPKISIRKGQMTMDKPSPYFIKSESGNKPLIIFDNSGKFTDLQQTSAAILVTKTDFMMRTNNGIVQYPLKDISDREITPESLTNLLSNIKTWFSFVAYPISVIVSFLYHLVQVIIMAIIGSMVAATLERQLDYIALLRLSSIAITPPLLITTAFAVFGIRFPYHMAFYIILSLVYLFCAILFSDKKVMKLNNETHIDDSYDDIID